MSTNKLRIHVALAAALGCVFTLAPIAAGDATAPVIPNVTNGKLKKLRNTLVIPTDAYFPADSAAKIALGKALMFDPILSGNQNISCATCHHPFAGTGDGLSLPVGEGGSGTGVARFLPAAPDTDAPVERVPRNAPHVWNAGADEFTIMFHDGRVCVDATEPSGFLTPAGANLPTGLDSALAAQAMFPVTSGTEMAGQNGENAIGTAAAAGNLAGAGGVWDLLATRLQGIPEYVTMFQAAYNDVTVAGDITYVHAANAIAAFEADQWRSTDSDFDRWLAGDKDAMSMSAKRGMKLFYGKANCSDCHAGTFQTDHQFHCISMPQIGAGKGNNAPGFADGHDDFGRFRESGSAADMYAFRTPSLRNTAINGPWGHAGAYNSLEAVVRHHLDPVASLNAYDQSQAVLPSRTDLDALDMVVMDTPARVAEIAAANELAPLDATDRQVDDMIAFMYALTGRAAMDDRSAIPTSLPSGINVAD